MKLSENYDKYSKESIFNYARKLIGITFADILEVAKRYDDGQFTPQELASLRNKYRKGGLGNLVEKYYFGYKPNSNPTPDFEEAGVELKVSPFEKTKKNTLSAGERLVLTMIDFKSPAEQFFKKSHVWQKCAIILLIYYFRDPELKKQKRQLDYLIHYVSLFNLNLPDFRNDLEIIEQDYQKILAKILSGRADEISEGDTMYLGACTKGKTAADSIQQQFYPDSTGIHRLAKRRAFCLKSSYMTYLLNHFILPDNEKAESLLHDAGATANFEKEIQNRIHPYVGKDAKEIAALFSIPFKPNKAFWNTITYRMLGIKGNRAEEFQKANIVVKVASLESKGTLKESVSFKNFKFKELIAEEWDNSWVCRYFSETKFFFVIFQKQPEGKRVLKGCFFWNMPMTIIDGDLKADWIRITDTIRHGVVLTKVQRREGIQIQNNIPGMADTKVLHVRPHAAKSYYDLGNGEVYGTGTIADSDELQNGQRMPKQSFWLNRSYIEGVIQENLKQ